MAVKKKKVITIQEYIKQNDIKPTYNLTDIAPVKKTTSFYGSPTIMEDLGNLISVSKNEDFKENSGYVSTKSDKFMEKLGSKYGMGYNDLQYEYINNQNDIRKEIDRKAVTWSSDTGDKSASFKDKALEYMTEEEVGVYNYYYKTEGKEKAQKFLDTLAETLSNRKAGVEFEDIQGKTTREILLGVNAGTEQFKQGIKNVGKMVVGKDDYIPQTSEQVLSSMIRQDLEDDGKKILGNSLGQIGYDVLTTGANMIPSMATGNPLLGAVVMGASASGNAYQQDLNETGDKEKAKIYATTVGALEGTLQYLIGGIGKLGGTSAYINNAVSGVKNGALRFALEYGGKIGSEALEEGLQEIIDPVVKNAVHGTNEEIDWENVIYSALMGGLMAGVFGASEVASTHLNSDEYSVVEKEIENRIKAKETDDKKLTKRDKNKIREQVMNDLEKGRIDTDEIGKMFAEESYNQYMESVKKEEADLEKPKAKLSELKDELKSLKAEREKLQGFPNVQKAVDKTIRRTDGKILTLEKQIESIKNNSGRLQLQNKMDAEVYEKLKDTRLAESYHEKARRGQAIEVDIESYDNERARKTAQNFINYGANNSNASHDFLDLTTKLAKEGKYSYMFMTSKQLEESVKKGNPYGITEDASKVEAFVNENAKEIVIIMDANKSLSSLVGHEVTHTLETATLYEGVKGIAINLAKMRGEYDGRWESIQRRYKDYTEEEQMQELVSDLIGDYLFGDTEFIRNLSTENPNAFQKIYNEIKHILKLATAGSKEARELERLKKEFEKVWRETSDKTTGKNRYSLCNFEDGRRFVLIDQEQDKFDGHDRSEYPRIAKDIINNKFNGKVVGIDNKMFVNGKGRDEFANPSKRIEGDLYDSKMRTAGELDNLLDAGTNFRNVPDGADGHFHEDVKDGFDYFDTLFKIGKNYYEARINIKNIEKGKLFKDVTQIKDVTQDIMNSYGKNPKFQFLRTSSMEETALNKGVEDSDISPSSNNTVTQNEEKNNEPITDNSNDKAYTTNAINRFSLKESVEETKELIAVHNLNSSELSKTLELGGLPMPSIAVIKAKDGHEMYGDVTLILPKETIDPKASKLNKVYGGDAWTPTYPNIEYKPNEKVVKKIHDKYYEFAKEHGYDEARPLFRYVNEMENELNREGGEASLLDKLYEDTKLMQMYLQDVGKGKVQPIVKETVERISEAERETNQFMIDTLGVDLVESFKIPDGENPMQYRRTYMAEHEAEIRNAYAKLCEEVYGFTAEEVENVLNKTETKNLMKIMRDAYLFTQNNGVTVKTETDYDATDEAIRKSARDGYKEWVDNLFKGVEEKTGIRNNADAFTKYGNRRSWDALHWENTLENVVKVMKQQDNGQAIFGGMGIWGVSAKEYGNIDEIKADSDRLRKMSDEEYEKVRESYISRLGEIAERIMSKTERNRFIAKDEAMESIVDSVRVSKTAKGILKELKQYTNLTATEKDASDIATLVEDISNMPTGYFEAKPKRAVGLDEVGVFVIPYDADAKLKQELLSKGYSIAEYNPNVEGDRKRVVNEFEQYKFRLADDNSYTSKEYGNHIYAKDVNVEETALAPTEGSKVAKILDKAPVVERDEESAFDVFMEKLVDKGYVFEKLAKKTNNRELEAKYNFIRYADRMAQDFIGKGKGDIKALSDIDKEIKVKGLEGDLDKYMYHMHNIDRMSLKSRYGTNNKAVYGETITADISRKIVAEIEAKRPELKKYAEELYKITKYQRQMLVDGGVISQETADLWEEMYPHYVPIKRSNSSGANINVPLQTGRTGINAPIKRAVGGSGDIEPLLTTMAERIQQTYKAVAKNKFGIELKNTLDSVVETQKADMDNILDGMSQHEELLQKGKDGRKPTFTIFENGERVTFEVDELMYEALQPTNRHLAKTYKIPNAISNLHRNLVTNYNPSFMLRNPIKDSQDALVNSQHPLKTFKRIPTAIEQIVTNGNWKQEYDSNGGAYLSYYDRESKKFVEEKSKLAKIIGFPLDKISTLNEAIEKIPRLAEYIASREEGRSIEVSMLDSARVTTNFSAGADLTKFLNRNGATFLNASVQGAMQTYRNFTEAKMEGVKGWVKLATKFAVVGLTSRVLNNMLWGDDEDYDELSDYVKQNYYIVAKFGDGKFVRIPKGRTVAVIQNAFEQMANFITGDDEVDFETFANLAISNLAPNNPYENNITAPIRQVAKNETWYGEDLVPTRLQDVPEAEQYDESIDSLSKWLGEKIDYSPYKINYLLDQYSGAIGDAVLPMLTPEAESGDDSVLGKMTAPLRSAFTTDSVLNNQTISDFYDTSDELTINANKSSATDEEILSSKYFNSVKSEIGKLYGEKREIQNEDLKDSEKYNRNRDIQKKINSMSKEALEEYDNVYVKGDYATVGDKQYRRTKDGWTKLSEDQIAKQNEVTSGLDIAPDKYWSDKEEYDFAYEKPEKYAIAKSVGGYDNFDKYNKVLNSFHNDENGTAKEKKTEYIFNLDIDEGQKAILYRSCYKNETDKKKYDSVIKEYLYSRDDISYEDMLTILEELGIK